MDETWKEIVKSGAPWPWVFGLLLFTALKSLLQSKSKTSKGGRITMVVIVFIAFLGLLGSLPDNTVLGMVIRSKLQIASAPTQIQSTETKIVEQATKSVPSTEPSKQASVLPSASPSPTVLASAVPTPLAPTPSATTTGPTAAGEALVKGDNNGSITQILTTNSSGVTTSIDSGTTYSGPSRGGKQQQPPSNQNPPQSPPAEPKATAVPPTPIPPTPVPPTPVPPTATATLPPQPPSPTPLPSLGNPTFKSGDPSINCISAWESVLNDSQITLDTSRIMTDEGGATIGFWEGPQAPGSKAYAGVGGDFNQDRQPISGTKTVNTEIYFYYPNTKIVVLHYAHSMTITCP